jgi:5,10-methylenetetrahydrofolate reductase
MGLRQSLESGKFAVTVEVAPPKGTEIAEMREVVEAIAGKVDAANVTDNQRAVMRLCPLAACSLLKEWGVDPVLQVTCRDRNRLALQSDLLGAWALGTENVLAMTGDYVTMGDHPEAKPVFDLDSVQLIAAIQTLKDGNDLAGNELEGSPDFYLGAVAHPASEPRGLQQMKLRKKVAAGAQFIQTQAIYDADIFKEFMKGVPDGVKVMAGLVPLRSARAARFMNENVPGIVVPDELIERMEGAEKKVTEGINITVELIDQLRNVCDGVHIMAIGMEKRLPEILEKAGFSSAPV